MQLDMINFPTPRMSHSSAFFHKFATIGKPLFTAFASVAFFKLLIFCIIEMKYMAIIIQARNSVTNANLTQENLRRQITLLHLKFYGALVTAIVAFWCAGQSNRSLFILLLYSFWVPQIILNIITESRKPLHPYFMYGMSLTRSVAPIYVFAVRNNFLREVNPDFPSEPRMCQILILWIGEHRGNWVSIILDFYRFLRTKLHFSQHPYHRHPDCRSLCTREIWYSIYDPTKVRH